MKHLPELRLVWHVTPPDAGRAYAEATGMMNAPDAWSEDWDQRFWAGPLILDEARWYAHHPDERIRAAVIQHTDFVTRVKEDERFRELSSGLIRGALADALDEDSAWTPLLELCSKRGLWHISDAKGLPNRTTLYESLGPRFKQMSADEVIALLHAPRDIEPPSHVYRVLVKNAPLTLPVFVALTETDPIRMILANLEGVIGERIDEVRPLLGEIIAHVENHDRSTAAPTAMNQVISFIVRHGGMPDAETHRRVVRLMASGLIKGSAALRILLHDDHATSDDFTLAFTAAFQDLANSSTLLPELIAHPRVPHEIIRAIIEKKPGLLVEVTKSAHALADVGLAVDAAASLPANHQYAETLLQNLPRAARYAVLPLVGRIHPERLRAYLEESDPAATLFDGLPLETLKDLILSSDTLVRQTAILKLPGHAEWAPGPQASGVPARGVTPR